VLFLTSAFEISCSPSTVRQHASSTAGGTIPLVAI
jgi:hypothetical protein